MFGDADLRVFFRDFGVPVVFNTVATYADGETIKGNLDQPGKDAVFGDITKVADQEYSLEIPSQAFSPAPAAGDVIQADGERYKVRDVEPQTDGALVKLQLRKLT